MYSNLVVGVDGHAGGRDAAALASVLASPASRMALVTVGLIEPIAGRGANPAFDRAIAEEAIEVVERERKLSGLDADAVRVSAGSVGSGLERIAEERDADLIVIGSCARGVLGRVLTGDDAASVLHHAHRAVAMAPKGYASRPHTLSTIGVAYDGLPESNVALAHARSLAAGLGARVVARHLAVPHAYAVAIGAGAGYLEDPEDLKARRESELGPLEGADLEVIVGLNPADLDAFSDDVDLLICGSRHQGSLRRAFLGSTSTYLSHHSRCPLLVTHGSDPLVAPPNPAEHTIGDI